MTPCANCGDTMEGHGEECNWCSNCGSFTFESGLYAPAAPAYFGQRADLLAACKAFIADFTLGDENYRNSADPCECITSQAIVQQIRAAIAKAESTS